MAAMYLKAAGGNYSAAATWSATGSGGADSAGPPDATTDVILEAGSGQLTIDAAAACRSLDCTSGTGTYNGVITHNAFTLTIGDASAGAGNVALLLRCATYTLANATTSAISFQSTFTATPQTVDFGGKTSGNVTFGATAVAGNYQYTGVHNTGATATVTLTKGTLDINGQTCSWGKFDSSNTNTRVLTLGAAAITITGASASVWDTSTTTGLTLTANTATITCSGASATFAGGTNQTYGGTIAMTGSGQASVAAGTLANFTRTGTAVKTDTLRVNNAFTVSGTLTITGNSSINRILVFTITVGTPLTITAATWSVTNTDFQDITGAGAGSRDFSAQTDVGDCGGNSGITFPASVAQYYGGVNLNGSYLRCNGIASNYVSAPDSAALSITGDIELQARVSLDDWTPSAENELIAKYTTTGNQRGYRWGVQTNGTLVLVISNDGTATSTATSSVATGFTDGTANWLKVTYVKSTGVVQFFTAADSASIPSSWTQLGTDQSAATTGIFDNNSVLELGGQSVAASLLLTGKFYRARVLNGVGGTVVFDADFTAQSAGTKSFTESSAQAATVSLVVTGGNWSASSWSTRVPLPQDDAYLGNAFSASQTVTADMPRLGRSIDWTGATGSPTWGINSLANSMYRSLTLISGMTLTSTQQFNFNGRGNYTITSAGKSFGGGGQNFTCPTGTYTLSDAFVSTGFIGTTTGLNSGSFNTNNFNVTCQKLDLNSTPTHNITFGTSTITLTRTSGVLSDFAGSGNWSVDNSTIVINNLSAGTGTFAGGGRTLGTLTYTVAGSTGELDITGSNSFAAINFSDASNARSLKFTAGTTTTIRNKNGFNVNGKPGKLMTVASITAATHTLSSSLGQLCRYLSLTNSIAQGGGEWYAGTNSTNVSGNTGWLFTGSTHERYPILSTRTTASSRTSANTRTASSGTMVTKTGTTQFKMNTFYTLGQQFTPTKKFITSVTVALYKVGSPTGNFTISVETNGAEVPSGTALASSTIDVSTLTTSLADYTFNIPCTWTSGKLWVTIKGPATWDTNNTGGTGKDTGTFTDKRAYSSNGGVNYSTDTGTQYRIIVNYGRAAVV